MSNPEILIRLSKLSDLAEMQAMFVDTICAICKHDYSPEQIRAWTSSIKNTTRWTEKLASQYFLVAELNTKIVGYASLESNHYLDLLYVHKDYQRRGIADRLCLEIENEAVKRNATILRSDVSKTARRFFEKRGFEIITPQTKIINGVEIMNYRMAKKLV